MNFREYCGEAYRTEALISPNTNKKFTLLERLVHAAMGIVTETGELVDSYKKYMYYGKRKDRVNIEEEIGDILWYLALWNRVSSSCMTPKMPYIIQCCNRVEDVFRIMLKCCDEMYSLATCKEAFESSSMNFSKMYWCCVRLIEIEGLSSIETIMINNIEKLKARYPDKFTQQHALDRKLEMERIALEGGIAE